MNLDLGPLPCQQDDCTGTIECTIADVSAGRTKTCSQGHPNKLVDQGGGARKIDESMKDLDRALARLGRTIKF